MSFSLSGFFPGSGILRFAKDLDGQQMAIHRFGTQHGPWERIMEASVLHDDDGSTATTTDSGILFENACGTENLKVLQTGEVTAIRFGNRGVRDAACINTFYAQILDLIEQNQCRSLILDMRGVWFLPSRTLGAFLSLRKCVDRVELHNVSDELRENLRVAQLDHVLHVTEGSSLDANQDSSRSGAEATRAV